jgi:hypothetical protein
MLFSSILDALSGKAAGALKARTKTASPFADRLLVDAIRLAELPSPAPGEEPRAAFVLERLKSFGLLPSVDETGSIEARLHSEQSTDEAPILLFTDLGSRRWHPAESLARINAESASGAGLSDSLGTAALLSIAESYAQDSFQCGRDLLLLFAAKSLDDPNFNFDPILKSPRDRPFAAIGVRGLSLDRVIHSVGSYRLKITVSGDAPQYSNKVTEPLINTADTILSIAWDSEGKTKVFIRHIKAETVYGLTPDEGLLEIEIESTEAGLLDMAMNAIKATAEKISGAAGLKSETAPLSFLPTGKPEKSLELFETVRRLAREEHIKLREENGADPASFFSSADIPALSLGIALGREGSDRDVINIESIKKGRKILERFILETGASNGG